MSSTPTIACSSGAATVSAMTLGLAPGKEACTTTEGGTTSGYSPTGSRNRAIAPAIVMNAETTAAKTGRSMKKFESFTSLVLAGEHGAALGFRGVMRVLLAHRDALRRDGRAGSHALQAVHHDGVAGREALAHHAQAINHRT